LYQKGATNDMHEDAVATAAQAKQNRLRAKSAAAIADYHAFCEQQRVEIAARDLVDRCASEACRFELENTDWHALALELELGKLSAAGKGMRVIQHVHTEKPCFPGPHGFMDFLGVGTYNVLMEMDADGTERAIAVSPVPKDGTETPWLEAFKCTGRKMHAPDGSTHA